MLKLLLLFIVVPIVEFAILIELGRFWGTIPTIALIVVTGFLGAALARRQGLGLLREMRAESSAGRLPTRAIVDGVIILLAGAVLITPGVLTDLFGFFCLIPPSRRLIRTWLWRRLKRAVREGRVRVSVHLEVRRGRGGGRPEAHTSNGSDRPLVQPDQDETSDRGPKSTVDR